MYQGRKLDCVYYYMRSLAASNPFLSARESLMQLFEDAARKVVIMVALCNRADHYIFAL